MSQEHKEPADKLAGEGKARFLAEAEAVATGSFWLDADLAPGRDALQSLGLDPLKNRRLSGNLKVCTFEGLKRDQVLRLAQEPWVRGVYLAHVY